MPYFSERPILSPPLSLFPYTYYRLDFVRLKVSRKKSKEGKEKGERKASSDKESCEQYRVSRANPGEPSGARSANETGRHLSHPGEKLFRFRFLPDSPKQIDGS